MGSLSRTHKPLLRMSVAHAAAGPRLVVVCTVAEDLRRRKHSCSADDWLREDLQFTLAEQVALGLAAGISSGAFDPRLSLEERAGHRPRPGFLANTALAQREAAAFEMLSATREQLRALLGGSDSDAMRLGWDHSAFEAKPFLREPDGSLLLFSPWALMSWMSRGIHYRALDAGHRRRAGNGRPLSGRWLRHTGALGEEHVRRLLAGSLSRSVLAAPRLHGEIPFNGRGGRQDSSDAAIDCWPDLVLVEVFSGRFAREARVSTGPELMLEALERATVEKIAQVLAGADDVLAGRLVYPHSLGPPATIWPLVVLTGDSIMLTPVHWYWIRKRLARRDDLPVRRLDADPRVRRPVIVDLDDLEPLLAVIEQGTRSPTCSAASSRRTWRSVTCAAGLQSISRLTRMSSPRTSVSNGNSRCRRQAVRCIPALSGSSAGSQSSPACRSVLEHVEAKALARGAAMPLWQRRAERRKCGHQLAGGREL